MSRPSDDLPPIEDVGDRGDGSGMPRGELGAIVGGGLVAIGLLLDGPWAIAVLLLAVVVGVWGLVTASRSD